LLLFILAMVGSYFTVNKVYSSLQINQIMMTIEGLATMVDEIPFPAVTFIDSVAMGPSSTLKLIHMMEFNYVIKTNGKDIEGYRARKEKLLTYTFLNTT
jgi:hypothetical protein